VRFQPGASLSGMRITSRPASVFVYSNNHFGICLPRQIAA
jgi:hypothetical protein